VAASTTGSVGHNSLCAAQYAVEVHNLFVALVCELPGHLQSLYDAATSVEVLLCQLEPLTDVCGELQDSLDCVFVNGLLADQCNQSFSLFPEPVERPLNDRLVGL